MKIKFIAMSALSVVLASSAVFADDMSQGAAAGTSLQPTVEQGATTSATSDTSTAKATKASTKKHGTASHSHTSAPATTTEPTQSQTTGG